MVQLYILTCRQRLIMKVARTCQGRTYLCKRLDLGERLAVVRPADLKYYTKTRDFCDVHVIGGRALLPHNVRIARAAASVVGRTRGMSCLPAKPLKSLWL